MAERDGRQIIVERLSARLAQAQRVLPTATQTALLARTVAADGDLYVLADVLSTLEASLDAATTDAADATRTYEGLEQTIAGQIAEATKRLRSWQSLDALIATGQAPASAVKRLVEAMLVGPGMPEPEPVPEPEPMPEPEPTALRAAREA